MKWNEGSERDFFLPRDMKGIGRRDPSLMALTSLMASFLIPPKIAVDIGFYPDFCSFGNGDSGVVGLFSAAERFEFEI